MKLRSIDRRLGPLLLALSVACLLAAPSVAAATSLNVFTLGESKEGQSMKINAVGEAGGTQRLFVIYEPKREECNDYPSLQLSAHPWDVSVTPAEGEPLPAGHFYHSFTGPPASSPTYGVCAYLAASPGELAEVLAVSCTSPEGRTCFLPYTPPATAHANEQVAQQEAKKAHEAAEALQREAAAGLIQGKPGCLVPKLRGHTLAAARRLLRRAHCTLGSVKKPHRHHGRLVVISQSAKAHRLLAGGARISVRLGR